MRWGDATPAALLGRRPLLLLGLAWLLTAAPLSARLLLDATRAGDAVVAVGERGLVLRSTDSGTTWETMPTPTSATLCAVSFATARHGWAVGHDGLILATIDAGRTWSPAAAERDLEAVFLDVLALDPNHVVAVGAFGLYRETHDGGATWRQRRVLEDDMHLNRLVRAPDGTLFLAGEAGTLLRSNDAGATWEPMDVGGVASLYGVLPLAATGAADDDSSAAWRGEMLAFGLRGHIFRSDDRGETWRPVESNTTALLLTGVQQPDGTIVLAGQARTWLASTDGGHSFHPLPSTPPAIAELLFAPDGRLLTFGEAGAGRAPAPEADASAPTP